jgi:nuclear pore complex protein Nup62
MFGVPTTSQPTSAATSAPTAMPTFGSTSTAAPTMTTAAPVPAATTAAPTAPTSTTGPTLPQLNFRQIQDYINKWTAELQEQEALFIENATKVNDWDRSVMANGEKIAKLNKVVDAVRTEHTKLERDLDYLKTQQQEFESLLEPLESSLSQIPSQTPAPEPEREHLYTLAESMDIQLQQMTEDLKEIIRHINDSNKPLDKSDPVSQIMKILNEHTDALQWIEDTSNVTKKHLDEVSKVHKAFRQDQEKSLRGMFKY